MDHSGEYDNFLQSMRDKAGVTATLDNAKYPTRYMGFDDAFNSHSSLFRNTNGSTPTASAACIASTAVLLCSLFWTNTRTFPSIYSSWTS